MEEESFNFNDVTWYAPVYSSGLPGVSVTNPADLKEWHGRVSRAHESEVREHTLEYDIDGLSDRELAEHGLVRLPVDADGEVIRVGDTLDYYGGTTVVRWLTLGDVGWSMTGENGIWSGFAAFTHHKPTVEDVLREFAEKITDSQIPGVHPTYEEAIAEYVAKLRLAGENA